MPETRAYKMNEQKQPAATEGMFLYYFYDRGKLSSVEVDEYKFDRLVELDTEMYNSDRVEKAHKATYAKADGKTYYKKIDMENDDGTLLDEKQRGMIDDITEQATIDKRLSALSEEDREIYELYYVDGCTQAEIAEEIGKTQSYVAKHLAKIEDVLNGSQKATRREPMRSGKNSCISIAPTMTKIFCGICSVLLCLRTTKRKWQVGFTATASISNSV